MTNPIFIKRTSVGGKVPTPETVTAGELAVNLTDEKLFFGVGAKVLEVANKADVVDKDAPQFNASPEIPGAAGDGILVAGAYAWKDLIGDVSPKTQGTGAAALKDFRSPITGWAHSAVSYGDLLYHIPHDYAPNSDLFLHVHWGHNGTNISGNFEVRFYASYAKGHQQADSVFSTPVATLLSVQNLSIANSPQYCHRVDEIQLSGGVLSGLLDTAKLEVDGLLAIHYEIVEIPSIPGSAVVDLPYVFTIDVHMQSTNVGTVNKVPNFYA